MGSRIVTVGKTKGSSLLAGSWIGVIERDGKPSGYRQVDRAAPLALFKGVEIGRNLVRFDSIRGDPSTISILCVPRSVALMRHLIKVLIYAQEASDSSYLCRRLLTCELRNVSVKGGPDRTSVSSRETRRNLHAIPGSLQGKGCSPTQPLFDCQSRIARILRPLQVPYGGSRDLLGSIYVNFLHPRVVL